MAAESKVEEEKHTITLPAILEILHLSPGDLPGCSGRTIDCNEWSMPLQTDRSSPYRTVPIQVLPLRDGNATLPEEVQFKTAGLLLCLQLPVCTLP